MAPLSHAGNSLEARALTISFVPYRRNGLAVTECLLLTGASGLVGSTWLPLLLRDHPGCQVLILSRAPLKTTSDQVSTVHGDLTQRNLGLSPESQTAITQNVTGIIHCAADIRFRLPIDQARATNTAGTRRLLALARKCKRLEKFAHISTVFVAGKHRGVVREEQLAVSTGFLNSYQQSKYEAEQLVFEAMRDIPAAIFRLSSIISDSTGTVRQFNYFHQLVRLIPRNPFPIIPGEPGAAVDLIASDWAASALALLYTSHFVPGRVYHVCAGRETSMTVAEILCWTYQIFNHSRATAAMEPRLVSLDEFERFATQQSKKGSPRVKELLRVLREFLPHLAIPQYYDNQETLALLRSSGLELPPIRNYYPRVVAACLRGPTRET
jgi:thioester reductase-like protein